MLLTEHLENNSSNDSNHIFTVITNNLLKSLVEVCGGKVEDVTLTERLDRTEPSLYAGKEGWVMVTNGDADIYQLFLDGKGKGEISFSFRGMTSAYLKFPDRIGVRVNISELEEGN